MGVSVGVAVGVSAGVSPVFAMGIACFRGHCRGCFRCTAACRGMPWALAVEIAMASAMGLHGVPRYAAAFRGSPWNARGSPWSVRGSPWSVRGIPWK